jgi:predicted secreted protein
MPTAWTTVLCSLGCANSGQPPPTAPPRITVQETAGQVTLAVGQELEVQLEANVTTGYRWELVPPVPEIVMVLDPGTYSGPRDSQARAGAGGSTLFVFRAVRPGKGVLELVYRRPWESAVAPARTTRVEIEVR